MMRNAGDAPGARDLAAAARRGRDGARQQHARRLGETLVRWVIAVLVSFA